MCAAALTLCAMQTFTSNREPVLFKVDDDVFMAVAEIPAGYMLDLLKMQSELTENSDPVRQFDIVMQLFSKLLVPDAWTKFERRLNDPENPIGLRMLLDMVTWLLGDAYGLRPTQSSLSSQEQSAATTGTSSTDGAPPEGATREHSPGTDSSTSPTTS